jgi:biotin transport system substrate-specific component
MTTLSQSLSLPRRTTLLGVIGFAAAVAAASQVAIPLPHTPVPITLQPMLVVIAGLMLGPIAGFASMALYLAAGAAGLPVFTPLGAPGIARFMGPTGGYLIAYPAAAFLAGFIATRGSGFTRRWLAALAGMAAIYVGGIAQLALFSGSLSTAVLWGIAPFAAFDVVKTIVAAAITGSRLTRRTT